MGHLADVGLERDHQEDAYSFHLAPADPALAQRKGAIFVVADGVGGFQAGEIASRMAADLIPQRYYDDPGEDVLESLRQAIGAANSAVFEAATMPGREKMATTVVCAVIRGGELYVGHLGDSRAYLLRASELVPLTVDHSWVAELLRQGLLSEEEAARHPRRHVITRALGSSASVEPEVRHIGSLSQGDRLLLCTDGLYEGVDVTHIATVLQQYAPQDACEQLIELANASGGADNATVIVVEVHLAAEEVETFPVATPGAVARRDEELPAGNDKDAPLLGPIKDRPQQTLSVTTEELAVQASVTSGPLVSSELVTGQKTLAEREWELQSRERELEALQQALAQREAELQERLAAAERQAEAWLQRQQAVEDLEHALAEQRPEEASAARESAPPESGAAEMAEQSWLERQQALEALEETLAAREQDLTMRERNLQAREQELADEEEQQRQRRQLLEELEQTLAERDREQQECLRRLEARDLALTQREQSQQAHEQGRGPKAEELAARERKLQERELALREREDSIVSTEQALLQQAQHWAEQREAIEVEEQELAERERACRELQQALEMREKELAAREQEYEERRRALEAAEEALSLREREAQEREGAVARLAADLEQEKEAVAQQRAALRQSEAALRAGLDQLQDDEKKTAEAQRQLADERAAFAQEQAQARLESANQRQDLLRLAERLARLDQALAQKKEQLAQAEARLRRDATAVVPSSLPGGRSISQWECVLDYRAGREAGEYHQEQVIRLPDGRTVECGLTVRPEFFRRRFPLAAEVWASSGGSKASRLLVGRGLDVASMPPEIVRERALTVLVNGDEMVPLPLEQLAIYAAVTRCEFATVAEHKVARDQMGLLALSVNVIVQMQ